jgi:hypothetical protein
MMARGQKVSDALIPLLRQEKLDGYSLTDIAKRHGLSKPTISTYTRDLFESNNYQRKYNTEVEIRVASLENRISHRHLCRACNEIEIWGHRSYCVACALALKRIKYGTAENPNCPNCQIEMWKDQQLIASQRYRCPNCSKTLCLKFGNRVCARCVSIRTDNIDSNICGTCADDLRQEREVRNGEANSDTGTD